jgi:hypothetical protein
MLRRRRDAETEAAGKAEGRQEEDAPVREGGDPAVGVYQCVEDGWLILVCLKEVFVAGGMPSLTYVDREHLNLEKSLRSELAEGFKIVAITGPTKSGKTVLCKKVIPEQECIWIDAGQIEKPDDLWGAIISELRLPSEETENQDASFSAGIRSLIGIQAQVAEGKSVKFSGPTKKEILSTMRERGLALVIDDFHYLTNELQTVVIRSLKSEVFEGLQVVLIAVPHRAFDAISAEPEMEGRYAHLNIPEWDLSDLIQIADIGFHHLGMNVSEESVANFSKEAIGSPLLMQRFCGRLCVRYDVNETVKPAKDFLPTNGTLEEIYRNVSRQFGFPTFEKLAKGPQSRSKRNPRRLKGRDGSLDIYQAILVAVGMTGPRAKLHYDEIRETLRQLLKETDIPQKHEVSTALSKMESIAKTKLKGEPVLEWSDDFLYLTNPFLMFYMRWSDPADLDSGLRD